MTSEDRKILTRAKKLLSELYKTSGLLKASCPEDFKTYLQLHYVNRKKREHFDVLYLDSQHRVLKHIEAFKGTIDACAVYPREIVANALKFNAKAVVLVHNHPSGDTDPSQADKMITTKINEALGLVDCKVLDHFIVGERVMSFAERGLL